MKKTMKINKKFKIIDSKKTILVTGGAGFIGSYLCEELLKSGHYVICMDNFFTGNKDNVYHLLQYKDFELIRHDICEYFSIEVDEIYNLACPASPFHYKYDPVQTIKANVYGTVNLLEIAKKNNAKILQASTSEIYGNPLVHPQTEDYWGNVNPIGERSCYDEGKRCAETLFFDYKRQYNIDIKIARIFNTYGPRMSPNDGRVMSNFIVQAILNEDITVYGNGEQTRSFCFVDDLVKGLILLMESDFSGPVNLGNPQEIKIRDLALLILDLTKSKSKIFYKDLPKDDPMKRKPDISLAQKKLLWNPIIGNIEGIIRTIEYFKEKLMLEYGEKKNV